LNVLAVIPARGGSKRVLRKNLRQVAGRPLIAWTIEQAKQARSLSRVVVSSEDAEILKVAAEWGCETVEREARLAGDLVSSDFAAIAVLQKIDADYVALLQPTSPLRDPADIDNAVYISKKYGAPVVSVTGHALRTDLLYVIDGDCVKKLVANAATAYRLNGAVYVAPAAYLKAYGKFVGENTRSHVMPAERSLDIDTEDDLKAAHEALERKLYEMVM
jgi:N-acylneuraminate cytidylyltransferase